MSIPPILKIGYPERFSVPRATLRSFSPLMFSLPGVPFGKPLKTPDSRRTICTTMPDSTHRQADRCVPFTSILRRWIAWRDGLQPFGDCCINRRNLTFNLVAALGIRGSSTGFGLCLRLLRTCPWNSTWTKSVLARQKRMLVVGAEDCNFRKHRTILRDAGSLIRN